MPRDADSWVRAGLLLLGLTLGVLWRVDGVGRAALFGDEYHTLLSVEESYATIVGTFDTVGSHVVLPFLQKLCLDTFGAGVVSFRLPALVPGILTILLFYPFARRLVGSTPALIATLALTASPMHVYYTRFGRSYALTVLLGLLLAHLVLRAVRGQARGRLTWGAAGFCAVLLSYTHLSSAGFVAGMALAALVLAWRERHSPRALGAPLATFGAAALVLLLLFRPLHSQLLAFVEAIPEESKSRPLGWFGVPTLLAGGGLPAVVWLIAFPVGLVALARTRFDVALVSLLSLLAPLALLLATMPHGMDYAYARYLLNAQPFVLIVVAWLLCAALRRIVPAGAWGERTALGLGVALVAAGHLTGPLGPGRLQTGTFDNTYLAMHPLPAFDAPLPDRSEIYELIARDERATRIIETPPLLSRAVLLLRNHALLHGKAVTIGWPGELPLGARRGAFTQLGSVVAEDADYLILHLDLRREVSAYWRYVFLEAWPDARRSGDESLMERHKVHFVRGQPTTDPKLAAALARALRERLGPPFHEDERVLVWKLRPE